MRVFGLVGLKSVAVTAALSPRAQVNLVVTSIIGSSSEYIREMISSSSTVEKGLPQSILLCGNGPDVTDPDSLLESTFKKFKRQIKRYVTDNDQTEQM